MLGGGTLGGWEGGGLLVRARQPGLAGLKHVSSISSRQRR